MARKIIFFILLLILCFSCKNGNQNSEHILEINNKELEQQIVNYIKVAQSENKGCPFIIRVYCLNINDSITRYVINSEVEPENMKIEPYHFICKIGGRDVFFTMVAGLVKKEWGKKHFFYLRENAYTNFCKSYFPADYKLLVENKQKGYVILDEPEMYYLTFLYDKLIKLEIKRGVPWQ